MCVFSDVTSSLRLRQRCELQQVLGGPAGLPRLLALARQSAAFRLSPLWRSSYLPLLDIDCSTLCGQVRSLHLTFSSSFLIKVIWCNQQFYFYFRPIRASDPAAWAVYTGVVDPLGSLFNPARSVSHIIAHQDYNHLTRTNDVALMRLSKAVDSTGAADLKD